MPTRNWVAIGDPEWDPELLKMTNTYLKRQ